MTPSRYHSHVPRAPLPQFVDFFWLYERVAPSHAMERVLPTGTMEIVIDLCGGGLRLHDRLKSAQDRGFRRRARRRAAHPVLRDRYLTALRSPWRPFSAGRCVVIFRSADLGTRQCARPSDGILGRAAAELRERVPMAQNAAATFSSSSRAVAAGAALAPRRAARRDRVRAGAALPWAQSWKDADLAEHVGLSQRRFIDLLGELKLDFGRRASAGCCASSERCG